MVIRFLHVNSSLTTFRKHNLHWHTFTKLVFVSYRGLGLVSINDHAFKIKMINASYIKPTNYTSNYYKIAFTTTSHNPQIHKHKSLHLTHSSDISIWTEYIYILHMIHIPTFYLTCPLAYTLTFYLAFFLAFYLASILTYFLAFYLASILALFLPSLLHSFWHSVYSGILSGIYSDVLSGIYSDILSGIYSDILSGILSEISWNLFWHSFCHLFWHSIWHLFRHSF